jgi:Zn-dependent protease
MIPAAAAAGRPCERCGTDIAPGLLACPSCHSLVHAGRLKELATTAQSAAAAGNTRAAVDAWQAALSLLPPQSSQHAEVRARLNALLRTEAAAEGPAPPPRSTRTGVWSLAAAAALFVWKFKFIVAFILTKGKLLLLGLGNGGTVLTMLASVGVYWTAWGLWFALAFVLSIYVHEIGHVAALRRYGVPATAPMFVPGLGAFISVSDMGSNSAERARIGLAGPLWGLGAALASLLAFAATGNPFWSAVAKVGAWINVFNLTPVWQLDGSRGFAALSGHQRWILVAATGGLWLSTGEGLLLLVLIVAAARAAFETPAESDRGALQLYVFLLAALSLLGAWLPGAA